MSIPRLTPAPASLTQRVGRHAKFRQMFFCMYIREPSRDRKAEFDLLRSEQHDPLLALSSSSRVGCTSKPCKPKSAGGTVHAARFHRFRELHSSPGRHPGNSTTSANCPSLQVDFLTVLFKPLSQVLPGHGSCSCAWWAPGSPPSQALSWGMKACLPQRALPHSRWELPLRWGHCHTHLLPTQQPAP